MEKTQKRRKTPDTLVSHKEAASMLGVTVRALRWVLQNGALQRSEVAGKVRLTDVSDLARHISKGFDLPRVASLTIKALVSANRAERRLDFIEELMGIERDQLELTEEAVATLHQNTKDLLLEYTDDLEADEVMEWARTFANITEEYLKAVQYMLDDDEPWHAYISAAQKLYVHAPRSRFWARKDLESAYAYLGSARRHLRQVAYFYIRHSGKRTKAIANQLFPEMQGEEVDEQIIDLIFAKK